MKFITACAIVLLLALLPGTASAGSYWRFCGNSSDPAHPFGALKVHKTSCRDGFNVAYHFQAGATESAGFKCREETTGTEGYPVFCRRDERRIKFRFGA